jgi:DNA-binding FadR family transcriptional regulator
MDQSSAESTATSTELVVAYVEELVFGREPGDSLPSEGDLAKALGVNRLTVREGMQQLAARGLVEVRNGRRPAVAVPDGRNVGDYFRTTIRRDPGALLDLLEVRRALEVHIAGLAATRAPSTSLAAMDAAIATMRDSMHDAERFSEADLRFHELLALATGNSMLVILVEELSGSFRTSRARSMAGHEARGLDLDAVIAEHGEILDAVRARDPRRASAAMRRHLQHTEKDLRIALS